MQPGKMHAGICVAIIVLLILAQSCLNFYKVTNASKLPSSSDSIIQAYPERYFILRTNGSAFAMKNIKISQDRKSLNCTLDSISDEHHLHLYNGRGGKMRYKVNRSDSAVLSEIHIYIPQDKTAIAGNDYTLSLDKVTKLEVLQKDKGRTAVSYVLGGLGFTVGAVAIVLIIAVALKSSCPFVSAYNNGDVSLQGEIYGGAIYPQLARNDYIQLKMSPLPNGNLEARISNELKEKQFTDIAELMVVKHNKNTQVLVDENGQFYSVANPISPISATASNKDILALIKEQNDNRHYDFDDTLKEKGSNMVQLTFNKPANVRKAKLILRLKNSYWMDYIYGKMTEGFGSYYTSFIQQQHTKPVEDLQRWIKEQQLPLQVSIQTKEGWQKNFSITTFGPLATRETAIPLNLDSADGNTINIQLSTGFMFWELDYAAIDFSDDAALSITSLQAVKATDETGKNVLPLIKSADGIYLEQPAPGMATNIEYAYKPVTDSNKTQTFVLHAKGYYEHVREFKGAPNLAFLEQFKKPNALSAYSMTMYKQTITNIPQTWLSKK